MIPYSVLIRRALPFIALAVAFGGGWKVRDLACDAATARAESAALKAADKANERANDGGARYEAERAQNAATARQNVTQVRTIYVETPPVDCAAPADARSLLDRAFTDANADTR